MHNNNFTTPSYNGEINTTQQAHTKHVTSCMPDNETGTLQSAETAKQAAERCREVAPPGSIGPRLERLTEK